MNREAVPARNKKLGDAIVVVVGTAFFVLLHCFFLAVVTTFLP